MLTAKKPFPFLYPAYPPCRTVAHPSPVRLQSVSSLSPDTKLRACSSVHMHRNTDLTEFLVFFANMAKWIKSLFPCSRDPFKCDLR